MAPVPVVLRSGRRTGDDALPGENAPRRRLIRPGSDLLDAVRQEERESRDVPEFVEISDTDSDALEDVQDSGPVHVSEAMAAINCESEEVVLMDLNDEPGDRISASRSSIPRRSPSRSRQVRRACSWFSLVAKILMIAFFMFLIGSAAVFVAKIVFMMNDVHRIINDEILDDTSTVRTVDIATESFHSTSVASPTTGSTKTEITSIQQDLSYESSTPAQVYRFQFAEFLCRPSTKSMVCVSSAMQICVLRQFNRPSVEILQSTEISFDDVTKLVDTSDARFSICGSTNWYKTLD